MVRFGAKVLYIESAIRKCAVTLFFSVFALYSRTLDLKLNIDYYVTALHYRANTTKPVSVRILSRLTVFHCLFQRTLIIVPSFHSTYTNIYAPVNIESSSSDSEEVEKVQDKHRYNHT